MKTIRLMSSVSACCILLAGCQTLSLQEERRTLGAAEVKQLFSGKTVESYNLNTKLTSFTYYDPSGRALQERLWAQRKGTWSVEADGRICLQLGGSKPSCRHIAIRGDTYYKIETSDSGKTTAVVRYRHFAPGNALARG